MRLIVNGEEAACILIKEGYARPWRGRREDWCVNIDPPESLAGIVCAASPPAAPAWLSKLNLCPFRRFPGAAPGAS
jgi:hypothetical protein